MAPQVLVLGMPRTGTQSIGEALAILGLPNTYHMTTVGPNAHHDAWASALEAKIAGKTLDKTVFDALLSSYDAVSDVPACLFARELMQAYPSARVVLSVRADEDAWVASVAATLHTAFSNAGTQPSRLASLIHEYLWSGDFVANGRAAYRKHNEAVLKVAEELGREVLVFDPQQGWESLCGFLGKEVPVTAYPKKDAWKGYKELAKEVEEQRLVEDATVLGGGMKEGLLPLAAEGIRMAYIYTQ